MVIELLKRARKDIENYCVEECAAYCCRKGFLVIKKEQLELVSKGDHTNFKKQEEGTFALELNKGCPSLKNNGCTVHKNPLRPQTCKDFPIFYEGNVVIFSSRCPASQSHYFYPLKHELKQRKISYAITNSIN